MKNRRVILITGAAGFVGHHMIEHILKNSFDEVIGIDSLTYAGTWDRLRDVKIPIGDFNCSQSSAFSHPRFTAMNYDFRVPAEPNLIRELKDVTHVLHMGAESHVDNSISDPLRFTRTNVEGTVNMLNLARELTELELFVYFSTDEVFGPAPLAPAGYDNPHTHYFAGFTEGALHSPKNPYAASKSAAEQFVTAFANTYELPCIVTRQMNIFGERQHPEKFIPLCINAALHGDHVDIHATPDKKQAGLRHYIHARNVADAHMFLLKEQPWLSKGVREVESYHIVGEIEMDNMELATTINDYVKQLTSKAIGGNFEMVDFHSSRPGHDLRYALDGHKMKGLGWEPTKSFHQSLFKMVEWTLENNNAWLKGPKIDD